jgi:cysteine-rich repeat protein
VVFALFFTLFPGLAAAYCVNPRIADNWRAEFPSLHIPVYVAIGDNSSVEHTGVDKENIARWVVEVIARHNETTPVPKLYYAGFSTEELLEKEVEQRINSLAQWQPGITIHSFPCEALSESRIDPAFVCAAATNDLLACGYQHVNGTGHAIGVVALVPSMCGFAADSTISWGVDSESEHDLAHTLLHELGHVLGLRHTNVSAEECGPENGNDPAGNSGVMRTTKGSNVPAFRHWRRDDIDGLEYLYGVDDPGHELALWRDESFPAAPSVGAATSMPGVQVIRAGSLADAPEGIEQPVVSVDLNRRVIMATYAADGSVAQPPVVVDPSSHGITVGNPEVALGHEHVFVAWTADEESTSESLQVRWAIRALSGGEFMSFDGFTQKTARLGAGFDSATSSWLLATHSATGELQMSIVDYDGKLVLEAASLREEAFDFGNPVCLDGICTVLFSTSELDGPKLGRIEFSVDPSVPSVDVRGVSRFDQDVYGRIDASTAESGWLRVLAGRHVVELGTFADAVLEPLRPMPTELDAWPLGLGADVHGHRLVMPLPIECGNGVVQGGEACDDGNYEDGDGCDMCVLGVVVLEPDDTGETGVDAGVDVAGEVSCNVSEPGRGVWLLWLLMSLHRRSRLVRSPACPRSHHEFDSSWQAGR